jgi:hypothetical protein
MSPLGHRRSETFIRRADAERFLREMQVDIGRGRWIDIFHLNNQLRSVGTVLDGQYPSCSCSASSDGDNPVEGDALGAVDLDVVV